MEAIKVKSLKLDDKDVDGISFSIKNKNSKRVEWDFTIMKLAGDDTIFQNNGIGYKYQIIFYGDDQETELFEAYVGDLDFYVKNLINANQEGLILKKCAKSEEIVEKLFRTKVVQSLVNGLCDLVRKKL